MKKFISSLCMVLLVSACAQKPANTGTSTAPAKAYVKVGKPYTVGGVTYVPSHQPNYKKEGMASWYGPGFHGKSTANGETFNKWQLTAAHPTLPMPSLVRVTHLKSGKSIVARINDRGPFSGGRIIDLSRRSAEELGMIGEGVARVRVEYLPEETDRLMQLVNAGKRPFEVDIENEVLRPVQLARGENTAPARVHDKRSIWEKISPVSSAEASEPPARLPQVSQSTQSTQVSQPPYQPKDYASNQPVAVNSNELPPLSAPVSGGSVYDVLPDDSSSAVSKPASKPSVQPKPSAEKELPDHPDLSKHTEGYFVRLATFSTKERAESLSNTFAPHKLIIEPIETNGRMLYRTRVGPVPTKSTADRLIAKAYAAGLKDAFIVRIQ